MSLLGANVFANPTTPLWGTDPPGPANETFSNVTILQGGSITMGSSVNDFTSLCFNKDVSGTQQSCLGMFYSPSGGASSNLRLTLIDENDAGDMLQVGDLRAFGQGGDVETGEAISLGDQGTGTLGLRLVDANSGLTTATYATFDSNGVDLSNVSSINGVPYFNAPGTQFSYSNYPGGSPLAEAPNFTVLNAQSFTPPVNGKLYVETLGTYLGTVQGGTCVMTLAINGTTISEEPTKTQAYDSNINFTNTYMYQLPVVANVLYDISSIAQCSALPPASADVVVTSSRMFLLFSPQ